jgi:hypothetical protein
MRSCSAAASSRRVCKAVYGDSRHLAINLACLSPLAERVHLRSRTHNPGKHDISPYPYGAWRLLSAKATLPTAAHAGTKTVLLIPGSEPLHTGMMDAGHMSGVKEISNES